MRNDTKLDLLWDEVEELKKSGGGGSDLPDVTEADNGKVLGVVNGAWNKMDAPAGGVDYSTTEQDTGVKWLDGKSIYSKTISVDFSALTKGQDNLVSHLIENIDRCINISGSVKYGDDWLNFPYVTTNNAYAVRVSNVNATNFTVSIGASFTSSNFSSGYVILYYTKTTTTETKKATKKKTTKNKED